jgi:peptidoglycan/LPS O-acetylase OafA/YrhL
MQEALPNSGDGRNNPWLDLVRSLAILLVLFRHGERAFNVASDGQPGPLGTIFINGWIGVDLFFVLSGYLIARHLIRRGVGSGELQIGTYLAMRLADRSGISGCPRAYCGRRLLALRGIPG